VLAAGDGHVKAPWDSDSEIGRSLLALIARETNDGIWATDIRSNAAYYSPKWLEMLGYAPGELAPVYASFFDRVHPDEKDLVDKAYSDYRRGKTPIYRLKLRMRHKDGTWRNTLTRGVLTRGADGEPLQIVGMMTDLDEQSQEARRLEGLVRQRTDELARALERAEFTAAAAIRFLATASHDLRQPLQATALLLGALPREQRSAREFDVLGAIDGALSVSLELLDALLEFGRLDAGATKPSIGPVDIGALIAQACGAFAAEAQSKRVRLRWVNTRLRVRSDRNMLGRILRNLLSNSVKYAPGGRVLVGCRRLGDKAIVEVWDTGPGIDAAEHERIFWEFYRVPASPGAKTATGLGLGLSIAQRLAAVLDHRLAVRSWPGEGSVFSIQMPIVEGEAVPAAEIEAPRNDAPSRLIGKLVAVIENDATVSVALARLLESWGAEAITAEDDDALLAKLGGRCPDLLILDRHLSGGKDGFQAAERLEREFGRDLPGIMLTGDYDLKGLAELNRRKRRILQKPAMPAVLYALLVAELGA